MERNMELVLRIMRDVRASRGDRHGGYTFVVTTQHQDSIHKKQPNSVLLPAELCPDYDTFEYHLDIMEEAGLIETTNGGYGGFPVCRLTWYGHDFLSGIEQERVMDHIRATHGNRWLSWPLDVLKTVSVEVAKQLVLKPLL